MSLNIAIDTAELDEPVWEEHPTFGDAGVRILVRSTESQQFKERHREVLNRMQMVDAGLGDSVEIQRVAELRAAPDLLAGWEGVTEDDGSEIPFSLEKARSWSQDRQFDAFFAGVLKRGKARAMKLMAGRSQGDRLGNSDAPSPSTSA